MLLWILFNPANEGFRPLDFFSLVCIHLEHLNGEKQIRFKSLTGSAYHIMEMSSNNREIIGMLPTSVVLN